MSVPTQITLPLNRRSDWAPMTLGELLAAYLETHDGKPNTKAVYATLVRAIGRVEFAGCSALDMPLADLEPRVIQRIHDVVARGVRGAPARNTASRCVGLIRQAWAWGSKASRGFVPAGQVSPCADVEAPRPRSCTPAISGDVVRALWDATDVVQAHPQHLEFLRSLMLVGLRPWDELLVMDCNQIFRSGGRWAIRLVKHKTDRVSGAKVRTLGTKAAELLIAQRDRVGGRGKLWPPIKGPSRKGHMDQDAVIRVFRLLVAEASKHVDVSPGLYTYSLRHGFATAALEAGATLTEIKSALGHDNIQSTLRYLDAIPGREGQTADLAAGLILDGAAVTLEDLAREVGCEPTTSALLSSLQRVRSALGLDTLTEIDNMTDHNHTPANQAPSRARWNHARFLAAASKAGIKTPAELARRVSDARKAANPSGSIPLDPRTARRYWSGERVPDGDLLPEVADVLRVSVDYLLNRDEYVRAESDRPAKAGAL
jgi:integrase/transcriptional regulator with XRE-family HTH domain